MLFLPNSNLTIQAHKTIMLSFVLYGCDTWSPKSEKWPSLRMVGCFHNLHCSQNIVRIVKSKIKGRDIYNVWKIYEMYKQFSPKTLLRDRRQLEDNIKMNLYETASDDAV